MTLLIGDDAAALYNQECINRNEEIENAEIAKLGQEFIKISGKSTLDRDMNDEDRRKEILRLLRVNVPQSQLDEMIQEGKRIENRVKQRERAAELRRQASQGQRLQVERKENIERKEERKQQDSLGLPIPQAQRENGQDRSRRPSIEMTVTFEEESGDAHIGASSEASKSRSITPVGSPEVELIEIESDHAKEKSKTPEQPVDLQIGTESEPPTVPYHEQKESKKSESEPTMEIQNIEKEDDKEEKKTVSQEIEMQSPSDNGSNGSESSRETDTSSDVSVKSIYKDNKGWLVDLDYTNENQVNYVMKMISAYAKVVIGKNKRVHLSWKREVMIAIGLDPSEIEQLKIKEENRKPGDPISMDRLMKMKSGMKARRTEGYEQPLIWALADTKKEPALFGNVKQLNKILKFLNAKGIGYKLMFYLISSNCNYEIGLPKQGAGIPFRFIRTNNMDDRSLEQQIRQVRKRFQQYAYQLKITHAIEEITIPAVRRVDKPPTVYPTYQTQVGSVYAGRPSSRNNNNQSSKTLIHDTNINSNRTVYYQDGIVLPGSIENLSPQPSPTGSIQAQESYEVLSTGEQRKVTITNNSMTVDTISRPMRYRVEASRQQRTDQNQNQGTDIDVQTNQQHALRPRQRQRRGTDNQEQQDGEIRDFDDLDDEKTPNWVNRVIRNQDRNMNTLTNLLGDRLSRPHDEHTNRLETRKREFDKYIEKLRIEHDLKTTFKYKLGKGRMTDVEAQVLQIEWYEEVERFAEKSGLREIDQTLLVKLVAENSLVNDVSTMYQDTVREDGQFESWDLFIDYIFEMLPIGAKAIKRVYQEFMEAKIRMNTIASVVLNSYKRKYRRLYLIQELIKFDIHGVYQVTEKFAVGRAFMMLPHYWKNLVSKRVTVNGKEVIPTTFALLSSILEDVESDKSKRIGLTIDPITKETTKFDHGRRINAIYNPRGYKSGYRGNYYKGTFRGSYRGNGRGSYRGSFRGRMQSYRGRGSRGMSTNNRGKPPRKRNDYGKAHKELRKERKRRYYDKYRDGKRKNPGRKYSIGRGRKYHDNKRRGFRGYSRRANRFKQRERKTRLSKSDDFANNISNDRNDTNKDSNKSNQERQFRFEYNPDKCYKCKRMGHFKKDCTQMGNRLKAVLERKAKREKGQINNISTKERERTENEMEDENMGLNIQSQSKRNERQTNKEEQQHALAFLSQSTNPAQSRSRRS